MCYTQPAILLHHNIDLQIPINSPTPLLFTSQIRCISRTANVFIYHKLDVLIHSSVFLYYHKFDVYIINTFPWETVLI